MNVTCNNLSKTYRVMLNERSNRNTYYMIPFIYAAQKQKEKKHL